MYQKPQEVSSLSRVKSVDLWVLKAALQGLWIHTSATCVTVDCQDTQMVNVVYGEIGQRVYAGDATLGIETLVLHQVG